ncbi:MAG TPA: hypothetical protein VNM22_12400 [Candidatus Limnocylindrales bacterium]|nr:hypothetical protein [Candidatus Limnocylindrales bacterium]
MATITYKVVELNIVTDETIEASVNEWVRKGWNFEGIHFVVTPASRRPSMAFIFFIREAPEEE